MSWNIFWERSCLPEYNYLRLILQLAWILSAHSSWFEGPWSMWPLGGMEKVVQDSDVLWWAYETNSTLLASRVWHVQKLGGAAFRPSVLDRGHWWIIQPQSTQYSYAAYFHDGKHLKDSTLWREGKNTSKISLLVNLIHWPTCWIAVIRGCAPSIWHKP